MDSNDVWRQVIHLARRQHGIVGRNQILALGVPRRTLERRTQQGLLTRRGRRMFVLPGTPDDLTTRSRLLAACYPRAVLTAQSAASLVDTGPWQGINLGQSPCAIHPRRRFPARFVTHPGVRSFRVDGCEVALPRFVVVDLLRFLPINDARRVAYRAVQTSLTSVAWLIRSADSLRGLRGVAQFRAVIADLRTGAHSEAESRLIRLIQGAGLQGWAANHRVRLGARYVVIDVAFPTARVAVEIDGRAHHTDKERFQRDRTRQNALVAAGWIPLRFTWEDISRRPNRVLHEIRIAVGQ